MRLCLALMLALASSAHADALRTARDQALVEVSHTVEIWLDHGTATYRVRRQFANNGKQADEAGLAIDLPYGAAATGLRIRAHTQWYDGELMERGKAAEIYQHLTGYGAYAPKDPALLQWLWADKLYLQVFPVTPHGVSTVEYTLTVPTRYQNGHYVLSYPRTDASMMHMLATPIVTVHAEGVLAIDGAKIAAGVPTALVPPVRDALATDPSASYGISQIVVPPSSHTSHPFDVAHIAIDIRHTYKSDLLVELVTPGGERIALFDRKGGGGNNIAEKLDVPLPAGTEGAGTWRLVASDHVALDTGTIDSWKLTLGTTAIAATDTPVFIPDAPESASDAGVAAISITPPAFSTWVARLGRVVASDVHAFARLEIDVAAQLVPLPKRAQIAFVIDASFSVGPAFLASELSVIDAYLTHVPDAEVEVIATRRFAQRVFGRFVRAPDVHALLAAHPIALGNGSALDEGARLATSILADRRGPTRVVVFTDSQLRTTLTPDLARAAFDHLAPPTIVHVVSPSIDGDDVVSFTRRDDDPLATIATHHHGILAAIGGLPAKEEKALPPIALELVRPTRIESVAVTGGFTLEADVLHEGAGVRLFAKTADAPKHVKLTGMLWSDPIVKELEADAAFSRATAAFVFGADEHQELTPAEMMTVAMMGRAVSPVTSYVAAEPGTRPSTAGFQNGMIGTGRYGTIGHGSGTGSGYGIGRNRRPSIDVETEACLRAHPQKTGWHVTLQIETTKDEIVDVAGPGDPLGGCLVETAWTVRLGSEFYESREHYTVELGEH